MRKFLAILAGLVCLAASAAEVIPPAPDQYLNDYAGVASAQTAAQLNQRLEQFERDSSCQILVAVYPKMETDSSIEDYTVRVAQSWKVGQKDKNNGAVLFVFIQDHKMFLEVGYGLEGVLPDAICKRIIENEIKPSFKAGNYDGGLTAGVNAILAAIKGEYQGNGQTVADRGRRTENDRPIVSLVLVGIVLIIIVSAATSRASRGGYYYNSRGWGGSTWGGGWNSGGGGFFGGGGGGGGFSGGGGGGGGFSGGGGSFGGGGAGGSW